MKDKKIIGYVNECINGGFVKIPSAGDFGRCFLQANKKIYGDCAFTSAIGALFSEESLVETTAEYDDIFGVCKKKEDVAVAAVIGRMLAQAEKKAEREPYYLTVLENIKKNKEIIKSQTTERIKKLVEYVGVASYEQKNMEDVLSGLEERDVVYLDDGCFDGGFLKSTVGVEKYIKLNQRLNVGKNISFDEFFAIASEKKSKIYFETRKMITDDLLVLIAKSENQSGDVFLYSNIREDGRAFFQAPPVKKFLIEIAEEVREDSIVEFIPAKSTEVSYLRTLYGRNVKPPVVTGSGISMLFLCDKKLVGFVSVRKNDRLEDVLFLYTDMVVQKIPRASKLLLYCLKSKEFMRLINAQTMWEHKKIRTAVFSKHTESMKYRGLFEKTNEKMLENGMYKLTYETSDFPYRTINSAKKEWIKKYGK